MTAFFCTIIFDPIHNDENKKIEILRTDDRSLIDDIVLSLESLYKQS